MGLTRVAVGGPPAGRCGINRSGGGGSGRGQPDAQIPVRIVKAITRGLKFDTVVLPDNVVGAAAGGLRGFATLQIRSHRIRHLRIIL